MEAQSQLISEQSCMLKKIDDYVMNLGQKIGEGSFSRVYLGKKLGDDSTVAVKKVRIGDVTSKIAKRLLEWEVALLREVSHPNIIHCLDIHFSANNCYIITEYCEGGNLESLLKQTGPFSQNSIGKIVLSVYSALQYLCLKGIIHRDIKISNILLKGGEYKIGDFGFAIKSISNFRDVSVGSPLYMSPEGLISNIYGPKTDVWAFGILIYQLLHGKTPLQNCTSQEELKKRVLEPPVLSNDISKDLKELILGCLNPKQTERLSIRDIGNSSYIQRVRAQIDRENIEEKELTLTNSSTCNSVLSTFSSSTLSQLTTPEALSLLHYAKFIKKIVKITNSSLLLRCLGWLLKILGKAKIKPGDGLRTEIKQLREQVARQFGSRVSQEYCLREVVGMCERGKKDGKLGRVLEQLGHQSQLLRASLQGGSLDRFLSESRSQSYFQQLLFQ